ncbi:hypothetical protein E4F34_25045 [Burkholderia pseudomallei]|nr:hypothetical protein [Burkholderia pseudomallei]MPT67764.1 hypothetical protein [Burkholderia pseudomallei]MPT76125.1 hypothetical protein [Burkholderia pseudomallei]MPT84056.1 hypothetical protein [Burkholderia pseudomallei]MPT88450.1 hypothetical protein [Burkholderia pseudomallei]
MSSRRPFFFRILPAFVQRSFDVHSTFIRRSFDVHSTFIRRSRRRVPRARPRRRPPRARRGLNGS